MRIAKDGKPFDEDNIGVDLQPNEIEVIQFLRPNGKRRRMSFVASSDEIVEMAKDMVISAEELSTGPIACYVRFVDEDEENELLDLAKNGPGEKEPSKIVEQLIRRKMKERTDFVSKPPKLEECYAEKN